ncbi:MAG: divalent-cation tolerance protein CutA, partial [Pseudomonadota bacterium]|nr:divalent-cation tolerance protein CutA [Pseudomonadota bacterium]
DEAFFAAQRLVEERLAACANIHEPVTSVYRWEGAVQQEQEIVLTAKTIEALIERAIAMVKSLHSHQLPCIIAYPVTRGFAPFMQWVADETKD